MAFSFPHVARRSSLARRAWKAPLAAFAALLLSAALTAPAQAARSCAPGSPYTTGPLTVDITVCIDDVSVNYVAAWGSVLHAAGGARVTACVLYTKVWHNNTLVANSARQGAGDCSSDLESPWFGKATGRPRRGTAVTAQSWFDVRYVQNGRTVTARIPSGRAFMTWWP
jgi:hypothetical protein